MKLAANAMVLLVAAEHCWFLVLEMFLWRTPLGLKTFHQTQEMADATSTLAMNQGLYNGFLAFGLVWALAALPAGPSEKTQLFFLGCVVVAGVFGAATAKKEILFVQGLPALVAFLLVWRAR
ncbi:MAG: DUF1304 domain-containing protein [Candidatus Wallbacteria bacterium]|nr:DUF1304 domain-containing protein [Candidatus Wallbacteria bacterium]